MQARLHTKPKRENKPRRMPKSYQDTIDAVGALRQSAPDTLRCLGMILDRSNADDIVRMYNTLSYPATFECLRTVLAQPDESVDLIFRNLRRRSKLDEENVTNFDATVKEWATNSPTPPSTVREREEKEDEDEDEEEEHKSTKGEKRKREKANRRVGGAGEDARKRFRELLSQRSADQVPVDAFDSAFEASVCPTLEAALKSKIGEEAFASHTIVGAREEGWCKTHNLSAGTIGQEESAFYKQINSMKNRPELTCELVKLSHKNRHYTFFKYNEAALQERTVLSTKCKRCIMACNCEAVCE
jgi:hypothetical protein